MLRRLLERLRDRTRLGRPTVRPAPGARARPGAGVPPPAAPGQASDYDGPVEVCYAPHPDQDPDPGEVVWTWVPYEEDATVGKDRPVVVIGRTGRRRPRGELAIVMLSSQDHRGDARWLVLGSGAWDVEDRVSSVRLDRVLAVDPTAVRREGATLERSRFDELTAALRARHSWA